MGIDIKTTCPAGYTTLEKSSALPYGACSHPETRDFFQLPPPEVDKGLVVESSKSDSAPPPPPKKMKIGLTNGEGVAKPDTSSKTPGDASLGAFRYFSTPASGPTSVGSTGAIVRE